MNRPIVKVTRVTLFPAPNVEPHPIEGPNVVGMQFTGGALLLTERLPDGKQVLWYNVPCRIEHEAPSGLVAGGGLIGGAQ